MPSTGAALAYEPFKSMRIHRIAFVVAARRYPGSPSLAARLSRSRGMLSEYAVTLFLQSCSVLADIRQKLSREPL
jgi:hypothetical protein